MRKISNFIICFFIIFSIPIDSKASEDRDYQTEMKQDILILMLSYPQHIVDVEKKSDDEVYIIMKSGKKIIYDDKKEKNHEVKLTNPDLQDMLEQDYPLERNTEIMDKNFDPGRARHYELLSEVYGNSKGAIEKNLASLKYGYTNYQFNKQNNANASLEAALKELMPLAKSRSDIGSILYPASGTFNYRVISGTGRLSPHSYGIAIDLKSDKRDYWKWSSEKAGKERLSDYPKELVEAFEKNNFVWGGKWGHFDILHFEYRPEIILKARYFANWNNNEEWFQGVPLNEETNKYIEIINNKL
ncbi:M15 family metallopeptidase [Clostridium beijerinckii]|uniref:M15 family metallopeptidase n=1 Tax=Clostridium beijerinckii TaxID=1520 RepID=A0AAE2RSS3_CLOBE|nr:M15 family metallopeptidase [Clostridium beijerinckii]MBF7811100.1 M15 family metallopeptidase [Clostridium beijerinckii]QUF76788.1 M15 family metallopeptidase [Clostridium beijerinckii]